MNRSSPALWSAYLHFEVTHGTLSRSKDLLYRSLRSCPWSKALYLLAFSQPFKDLFSKDELSQLSQLMADKELRLRLPFPEEGEEEEEEGELHTE